MLCCISPRIIFTQADYDIEDSVRVQVCGLISIQRKQPTWTCTLILGLCDVVAGVNVLWQLFLTDWVIQKMSDPEMWTHIWSGAAAEAAVLVFSTGIINIGVLSFTRCPEYGIKSKQLLSTAAETQTSRFCFRSKKTLFSTPRMFVIKLTTKKTVFTKREAHWCLNKEPFLWKTT